MKIKTTSDLKRMVEQSGHDSHFFTRKAMSFFGDTIRNYGVRLCTPSTYGKPCYELYRRRPVKHGLWDSAYFDAETFRRVILPRSTLTMREHVELNAGNI